MNKKFGKLEDGNLIYAPSVLIVEDKQIISPSESDYLASGYLPIVLGVDLEYKEGFEIITSYRIVEAEEESDNKGTLNVCKNTGSYHRFRKSHRH